MTFNINLGESKKWPSLSAVKADLVDTIFYDDLAVLTPPRVHDVDNAWAASLKEHTKEDIELSKKVAGHASAKSLDFLDDMDSEVTDKANDMGTEEKSGNHGTAEEKKLFVLSDEETGRRIGKNEYPSAVGLSMGNDQRLWCPILPSIRTSLSLVGRSTHVWLVRESVPGDRNIFPSPNGDEMIMQTAWRDGQRTPVSVIYSVRNLSSDLHDYDFLCDYKDPMSETPLYRLTLSTVGRPMWSYTTDLDLLTGFRDALQTHQRLCDEGILHSDISADNILLSKDSAAPFRGFIIDLDFAHIEDLTIQQPEVTLQMSVIRENKFLSPKPMTRRQIFEGTSQFMSRALLRQAKYGATGFVHGPNDDVESFIWVFSYCVMRNLYRQASHHVLEDIRDQSAYLRAIFHEAFGQVTTRNLVPHRHFTADALVFPMTSAIDEIIAAFMSDALIDLFGGLQDILADAHKRTKPTPLTHDIILTEVDIAIGELEEAIALPLLPGHGSSV